MVLHSIFESSTSEERWITQISKILEKEVKVDIDHPVSIFRVPATLSVYKPKAYVPQLIGLGPYHHFQPELYEMERCKLVAASRLRKQFNSLEFKYLVAKLNLVEQCVRACYHKYLDIEGDTLAWIMAIDGLFLLDFFFHFNNHGLFSRLHRKEASSRVNHRGHRDARKPNPDFCYERDLVHPVFIARRSQQDVAYHVDEFLVRGVSTFKSGNKEAIKPENEDSSEEKKTLIVEEIMIPSVSQLASVGVEFCPTGDGKIRSITFDQSCGRLYLPIITLNVNSEVIMRNLVAYEASIVSEALVFTRYTELMNGIIDTVEDAKLMREKKIIVNSLRSDADVVQLFNGMSKAVRLTNVPFLDKTIEDVNKYYNNTWQVRFCRRLRNIVFGSWQILTVLAIVLLVLLMGLESFCSVYSCPKLFNTTSSSSSD
ncbi:transmembrane protein, putative [Actinidia rufa]|uniref:Transmembrane protein, putative n=1 Tax=Actinidia rufa TaxID=165716 RepID=A0A7J0DIK3_9ERIC|nr:transmembrane protein, putative [Actinidia rufa]